MGIVPTDLNLPAQADGDDGKSFCDERFNQTIRARVGQLAG